MAPSTVNNHLASFSIFTTWVHAQAPSLFPVGDPAKVMGELGLPPLEPSALNPDQVRSLKNVCDRLDHFYRLKKSMKEKKQNYFKTTSISTNRVKSAVHTVPKVST